MSNKLPILAVLLLLQLALAAWLFSRGLGDDASAEPFADVDAAQVLSIRVATPDADVELARGEAGWRVADHPADGQRVDETLASLLTVTVAWPVASTSATAERFEVADDNAQRRIELLDADGNLLAAALLGTSPGYQRVHLRRADQPGIYAVALSHLDFPETVDGWLDRELLQPAGRIEALSLIRDGEPRWTLEESETGWTVNGEPADQEAISAIVARLTGLRVSGVSELADAAVVEPFAELSITADDDGTSSSSTLVIERWGEPENWRYQIGQAGEAARYGLAAYIAEQLDVDAEVLVAGDSPATTQ